MKKKSGISESVLLKSGFKRKFSLYELYRSFVYAPRAASKLIGNRKTKLLDPIL